MPSPDRSPEHSLPVQSDHTRDGDTEQLRDGATLTYMWAPNWHLLTIGDKPVAYVKMEYAAEFKEWANA